MLPMIEIHLSTLEKDAQGLDYEQLVSSYHPARPARPNTFKSGVAAGGERKQG